MMFALLALCLFGFCSAQPAVCGPGSTNGGSPLYVYTASSVYNYFHCNISSPNYANINSDGAWCPAANDHQPWLQINLLYVTSIASIATQGRGDAPGYVTVYSVAYSNDESTWTTYPGNFIANNDQNSIVVNKIYARAQYFRIYPLNYSTYPSMRVCIQTLPDLYLSATTSMGGYEFFAPNAFIGSTYASWCASSDTNIPNDFIAIDLGDEYQVDTILTQGHPSGIGYVASYTWSWSVQPGVWYPGWNSSSVIGGIQPGNHDCTNVAILDWTGTYNTLNARWIRIYPQSFSGWPCMSVGVQLDRTQLNWEGIQYVPPTVLPQIGVGNESPDFCSGHYSATTEYHQETDCLAFTALINYQAWCPASTTNPGYLLIDLLTPQNVAAIYTQGRGNADQYVSSYYIYKKAYAAEYWWQVGDLWSGNWDQTTINAHVLNLGEDGTRWLKIVPVGYFGYPSMRVCLDFQEYVAPTLPAAPGSCPGSYSATSTYTESDISVGYGKLNSPGAWCPATANNPNDFLEVDLGSTQWILSLSTQGRATAVQWVSSYNVFGSIDGISFTQINELWQGNNDQNTIQTFSALQSSNAYGQVSTDSYPQYRWIRFYPVSYYQYPCFRVCVTAST